MFFFYCRHIFEKSFIIWDIELHSVICPMPGSRWSFCKRCYFHLNVCNLCSPVCFWYSFYDNLIVNISWVQNWQRLLRHYSESFPECNLGCISWYALFCICFKTILCLNTEWLLNQLKKKYRFIQKVHMIKSVCGCSNLVATNQNWMYCNQSR